MVISLVNARLRRKVDTEAAVEEEEDVSRSATTVAR